MGLTESLCCAKETGTTLQINHTSRRNKKSFVISRIYSHYIVILSYRQFRYQTYFQSTHLFQHKWRIWEQPEDNWNFVLLMFKSVHERHPENYKWLNGHTPMSNICQRPQFILSEMCVIPYTLDVTTPSTLSAHFTVTLELQFFGLPTSTGKFQVFFKTKCPIFWCFLTI